MSAAICVFEDEGVDDFGPLTLTRPAYELLLGRDSLLNKLRRALRRAQDSDGEWPVWKLVRPYLVETADACAVAGLTALPDGIAELVLVNARTVIDATDPPWTALGPGEATIQNGEVVCARMDARRLRQVRGELRAPLGCAAFEALTSVCRADEVRAQLPRYPWELIGANPRQIEQDTRFVPDDWLCGVDPGVIVLGDAVRLERGASVDPGCVLDSREGPVLVEAGAHVRALSVVEGPVMIGRDSRVDGACVRGGTTLGPVSRIGGEIAETIVQGYTNKGHEGFVGHSYLGQWVNVGALATTSDLKNNYHPVRVNLGHGEIATGEMKIGATVGDFTKLGIGVLLNTGSVVGVSCNIFAGDMPPKFVPSFAWGDGRRFATYRQEQASEDAATVMARRGVTQTEADRRLLRNVFEATASARKAAGIAE